MALQPDLVIYLDIDVETLIPRVVQGKGMDHWESGMHLMLGTNLFESFQRYQTHLIEEYQRLASEFGFITVDARQPIDDVQTELRSHIMEYLRTADPAHNAIPDEEKSATSTEEE
jgi:thymidylate kinase